MRIKLSWAGNAEGESAQLLLKYDRVRVVATAEREPGDAALNEPSFTVRELDSWLKSSRRCPDIHEIDGAPPSAFVDLTPDGLVPYRLEFQLKDGSTTLTYAELLVVPRTSWWLGWTSAVCAGLAAAATIWLAQILWSESANGLVGLVATSVPLVLSIKTIQTSARLRSVTRDARLGLGILVISLSLSIGIMHCGRLVYVENLSPSSVELHSNVVRKLESGHNAIVRLGSFCGAQLTRERFCRRWAEGSSPFEQDEKRPCSRVPLDADDQCQPSPGIIASDAWLRLVPGLDRFAITCRVPEGLAKYDPLVKQWRKQGSCDKELEPFVYDPDARVKLLVKPSGSDPAENDENTFVHAEIKRVPDRGWARPPLTISMKGTGYIQEVTAELNQLEVPIVTPMHRKGGVLSIELKSGNRSVGTVDCPDAQGERLRLFELRAGDYVRAMRVKFKNGALSSWQAVDPGRGSPVFVCAPNDIEFSPEEAEISLVTSGFCDDTLWSIDLPEGAFSKIQIRDAHDQRLGSVHCSAGARTLRLLRILGRENAKLDTVKRTDGSAWWNAEKSEQDALGDAFFWCDDEAHPPQFAAFSKNPQQYKLEGTMPNFTRAGIVRAKCYIDNRSHQVITRRDGLRCTSLATRLSARCSDPASARFCEANAEHWLADRRLGGCSVSSELCDLEEP